MKICEAKICLCPQTALAIAPCYRGERAERRTEPNTVRVPPAPPHAHPHCMLLGFFRPLRRDNITYTKSKMQNRYGFMCTRLNTGGRGLIGTRYAGGPHDHKPAQTFRRGEIKSNRESRKPVVPTYAILTPGRDRENLLSRDSRAPRRALLRRGACARVPAGSLVRSARAMARLSREVAEDVRLRTPAII